MHGAAAGPSGGTPTTTSHNYAVHALYIGSDRQGVTSTTAWKNLGYNIDNLVTTASSTDVCTLQPGASMGNQADGTNGIDNSFGANIWPIVLDTVGANAQDMVNSSILAGHFTMMTYVTGFDDTAGSMTSATGITGVLLAGGLYADGGMAPSFTTDTHWPIVPTLITNCTATGGCPAGTDPVANAMIKFGGAYQANGTFVSGAPANLSLTLALGGNSLAINILSAVVTFQPNKPGSVTNGTIAGTIVASDLVAQLRGVAGSINTSLCAGSVFNTLSQEINQSSDIIIDPSTGAVSNTKGTMCNGISIGVGFDSMEIAAPTAADIEPGSTPSPNPCDAGTD